MTVKSDIQIAQEAQLKPIGEVAAELGLSPDDLELYGKYKAKINSDKLKEIQKKENGKVILVTSINPTPAGEGKSTVTIGLVMLYRLNKKVAIALRAVLGPVMGIKGGGRRRMRRWCRWKISSAFHRGFSCDHIGNNALAALLDNHIHQGMN